MHQMQLAVLLTQLGAGPLPAPGQLGQVNPLLVSHDWQPGFLDFGIKRAPADGPPVIEKEAVDGGIPFGVAPRFAALGEARQRAHFLQSQIIGVEDNLPGRQQ